MAISWTEYTHNNGNPGGDGQTGDAGEGRGGTDCNNIVQVLDPNTDYPVPWENATLFKDAEVIWASFADNPNNPSEIRFSFMHRKTLKIVISTEMQLSMKNLPHP